MHSLGIVRASAVALAGVFALAACAPRAQPPSPGPAPAAASVALAEVVRGAAEARAVPASVHARERATLSARIAASIVELPHREGDAVAQGALLVRLDDAALRAALAAAEAGAQAAQSDRARAQALLEKGAATPREREQAEAAAAAARAAVSAAQDALAYAVLRAPFAGRIVARPASLGDVAGPGKPLVELEGAFGLELRAALEQQPALALRPGQRLRVLVDGQPQPLQAIVRVVVPAADPATHRFEIRADLPQAAGLRAGLFARLLLPAVAGEERLLVPTRALLQRGGLVGAFVVDAGRARLRWIAVGAADGEATEVRAGLDAGERVVLDPAGLADGAAVRER
jgi:RND family efflux transporter MFP subunit